MTRSSLAAPLRRKNGLQRSLLALFLSASTLAFGDALGGAQESTDGAAITLISMEKDCFGCSAGERLVLRRDGQASLVLTGKARHGTQDQLSLGTVGAEDFEALARLTLTQGFTALLDNYDDTHSRDGAWTIISVEHSGGTVKQVFRRAGAGPAALDVIEAAMQQLRGRITFERKHP